MKKSKEEALYLLAAYCSKAERCEYDLYKKMRLWELDASVQASLIQYLRKEGYLNDERYLRSFVNDKFKYNKWGSVRINHELKLRKFSDSQIKEALSILDEDQTHSQLTDILSKKLKNLSYKDSYDRNAKLVRFAMSRGYDLGLIMKILKQIDLEGLDEMELD